MFKTMGSNWWTTLIGIGGGIFYYLGNSGVTQPTNKQEWINLGVGVAMAALGYAAKDATTGSAPK
jgi:hypothetical protein